MGFKIKIAALAVIVALCASAFAAFNTVEQTTYKQADGDLTVYNAPAGKEDVIVKNFTLDTLTTTEVDVLELGYQLASPYQYSYQIYCRKLSGTPNLKIVLQERNSLSNTDWVGADSLTISGADSVRTYFRLRGTNVYGQQQRLRLVGTTGVNQYRITGLLKKTK